MTKYNVFARASHGKLLPKPAGSLTVTDGKLIIDTDDKALIEAIARVNAKGGVWQMYSYEGQEEDYAKGIMGDAAQLVAITDSEDFIVALNEALSGFEVVSC